METRDENIINLEKAITNLDQSANYFIDLFGDKGIGTGILRLKKGEIDTQLPHSVDEVYFVVQGNGSIEIEGRVKRIKTADFIFVPANAHHKFLVDDSTLVVIYFLGS
jgi:mannose-6-phosphate isomerase-like protein (cupin superfamily)